MKDTSKQEEKSKKGFWATIWESMTKTGGCCGSGGSCCGSAKQDQKSTAQTPDATEGDTRE
jgi:hypothetical protein